jgi:spore germination protein YaaH
VTPRGRIAAAAALALACAGRLAAQGTEALWYATADEDGVQSFLAHAGQVSVVAPQTFFLDSAGYVWGSVDPRIVAAARARGVKVVPLVMNAGFDQPSIHRVLSAAELRTRAAANIAALCRRERFDGIQFDFENVNVADRDLFTAFFRETAAALHAAGCTASAAVVPRTGEFPGPTSYHVWIYENWRGAYDYRALADAADFLSLMTYDQHTHRTPPGPVAGVPWMVRALEYVLSLGVPPGKVSLGIPAYSTHWEPSYDPATGAHVWGSGVSWKQAAGLMARGGATPVWDDRQKVSFAAWDNDGIDEFLYLEDARSFAEKLSLVGRYHLRGYSVWVLGSEDPAVWEMLRRRGGR